MSSAQLKTCSVSGCTASVYRFAGQTSHFGRPGDPRPDRDLCQLHHDEWAAGRSAVRKSTTRWDRDLRRYVPVETGGD